MSQTSDTLRDKILASSREMLIKEGYQNLSMRKIAKQVNVTATSIYLHFESKDDLLHILMEQSIENLCDTLEDSVAGILDPYERMEIVIRTYVRFALDNPAEYQIIYLVRTADMKRFPKEKFRKARRGYDLLAKAIEEGVEKGDLEVDKPLVAAYSIWAQLHGVISVVMTQRLDTRIDKDEFIESSVEHILQGFLTHKAVL